MIPHDEMEFVMSERCQFQKPLANHVNVEYNSVMDV